VLFKVAPLAVIALAATVVAVGFVTLAVVVKLQISPVVVPPAFFSSIRQ